ncbi:MAG: hypothetical protein Kow0027_00090 [Saprospiraceae bacterium]
MAAQDPAFAKELEKYFAEAVPQLAQAEKTLEPLLTISVVVHIIHNGEPVGQGQNLSDEQVMAQIAILNEDYAALNPQFYNTPSQWAGAAAVPNIQFCLASVDPDGNPTNGIDRQNMQVTGSSWSNNNINSEIKPAINWDPSRYMNVYVLPIPGTTAAGGVVGFANYPTPSLVGAATDGIVIDYRWFGAPGYSASGYRPLTHEVGHYLGVPHPFQGNSCNSDDGISDTPNIDKATREYVTLDCDSSYPAGPVSCGNEHMYVNYMDYVNENCYTSFTQGQINVMRAVLQGNATPGFNYGSRENLLLNAPNQCNLIQYDAGVIRLLEPAATTCTTDSLSPVVTIRNFGVEAIDSVYIVTQINNNSPDSFLYLDNLFAGENVDVILPGIFPPDGLYTLTIYTAFPGGQPDERTANDTIAAQRITFVSIPPPLNETFEDDAQLPTNTGLFSFNVTGDDFEWEITNLASAYGEGQQSVLFDNFAGNPTNNPFGTIDALITRHYDLRNQTGTTLKFDVAHAPFSAQLTDTLVILVATDCSQVFNQLVFVKGGESLSTAPPTENPFIPTPNQWREETVDLSFFDGMEDVTLAFLNLSGWGNRLYLDNIRLGQSCSTLSGSLSTTASACGQCTGTAEVQLAGGNPGFAYTWSSGSPSGNGSTGLCPGAVAVTVTDALGCELQLEKSVPQEAAPSASLSVQNESAYQASDGSAQVQNVSGQAPFSYLWSTGASGNQVSNLSPGAYWVEVTDVNGCDTTLNFTIEAYNCGQFSASISGQGISCNGANDGVLSASGQQGNPPYTYLWSTGQTGQSISQLGPGSYSVTVTAADNCPAVASYTLTEPAAIVPNLTTTNETSNGASDGTATANPTGGMPPYNYLWSTGATSQTVSGLAPGNYSVTVSDQNGCLVTENFSIQPFSCAGFTVTATVQPVSCFGLSNGAATLTATGGNEPVTYLWSNGATGAQLNNVPAGFYSATVTDASQCQSILTIEIPEPDLLIANATATNESTAGANDGTAQANPTGGTAPYSFQWSNGSNAQSLTNLSPGTYTVTVFDQNNCEATQTVVVQEGVGCNIQADFFTMEASCPDVADGYAEVSSVSGGSGPYQYLWSNGSTQFFLSNVPAGSYTVTISDAGACSIVDTVEIGSADQTPPTLVLKDATVYIADQGIVAVNPEDVDEGTFDNCSMVNIELTPGEFYCGDAGGTYPVIVKATDSSGNSSIDSVMVTVLDTVPPEYFCESNMVVSSCEGVPYEVTAIDNCSDVFNEIIEGPLANEPLEIGVNDVVWRATDDSGNESFCHFTITVVSDLSLEVANVQHSTGAADGSIELTISGGQAPYTINWYLNGDPAPGLDPAALLPGIYTAFVVDASGCSIVSEEIEIKLMNAAGEVAEDNQLLLYPNPAGEVLYLDFAKPVFEEKEVRIYNNSGQLVHREILTNGAAPHALSLRNLPSGIYQIQVASGQRLWLRRFAKM